MTSVRALVAAAVALVAVLTVAGDARPARDDQSYLQFNLCGNACNRGALAIVDDVVATIGWGRPRAVTLNEICENQYDLLRSRLPGYGGVFDPTGATCRNGARYGNAILAQAGDIGLIGSWELPNPAGDEPRRLMCVRADVVEDGAPLTLCVTHISNESGNIAAQVNAVAGILSGLEVDGAMLIGGDFNTNPADPGLDPMYASFVEADSAGSANRSGNNVHDGADLVNEDTYGPHKYDYLFFSAGDWSITRAYAVPPADGFTDHDALWARATKIPTIMS